MKKNTIPFDEEHIKAYLDRCIVYWRKKLDEGDDKMAPCYIDAFQSVRMTLYDELLPNDGKAPQ